MESLPPNVAFPAPAAEHLAPVALHRPMETLQGPNVAGNAVVPIVAAEYLIEVVALLPNRQVPHPSHQVLRVAEGAAQARLFRTHADPKIAFPVTSAIQGEAQKVNRFRASPSTLARPLVREAAKFDELGFRRFQSQAKPSQSLAHGFLGTKSILAVLETHHKWSGALTRWCTGAPWPSPPFPA